jgi:prolipoprotein diacylglyceryl transferase
MPVSPPLASIPSPSSSTLDLGPLTIHLYGLMLLIAIAVAATVAGRRWVARGGEWDLIFRCIVWGVGSGIVGARLYHLVTSWDEVPDEWWGPFAIWKGGLGVWGGIAAGCIAGAVVARREGVHVGLLADCLAPGLLLAQAVGRLGNYFNQELYGRPTDLPWGLEIDAAHFTGPGDFAPGTTFHPTFLYEILWNTAAVVLLVFVIERRLRPRPPSIFAAYVTLYCLGRFFTEWLRIDPAHEIGPLRLNGWVSLVGVVTGVAWYVRSNRTTRTPRGRRRRRWGGGRRGPSEPQKRPAMTIPKGRR